MTALMTTATFAGGDADQSYILGMVNKDVKLFLTQNFDLDNWGNCVRAGRHTGLGGMRLLPCSIEGKLKPSQTNYLIELDGSGEIESITKTNPIQ